MSCKTQAGLLYEDVLQMGDVTYYAKLLHNLWIGKFDVLLKIVKALKKKSASCRLTIFQSSGIQEYDKFGKYDKFWEIFYDSVNPFKGTWPDNFGKSISFKL